MEDPISTEPRATDCGFTEPDTQMQESSSPYSEASSILSQSDSVTELPKELHTIPRSPSPLIGSSTLEQTVEGFTLDELLDAVLKIGISEHPVQPRYPPELPSFLVFATGILVFEYTLLHWTETLDLLSEILNGVLWLGLVSVSLPLMVLAIKQGLNIRGFACKNLQSGSFQHFRTLKSRVLLLTSPLLFDVPVIILEVGLAVKIENLPVYQTADWQHLAPSLSRFFLSFIWRQTISWTVLWMNMAFSREIYAMIEKFINSQTDSPNPQARQTDSASQEHLNKLGILAKFIRGQLSEEQIEVLEKEQELMTRLDRTRRQLCECHNQVTDLAIRVAEIANKDTAVGTGLSEATMADMQLLMDVDYGKGI
ncbi:MAG: hypothetical protein LQ351_006723 [Letrouitia transgressa]|nr:MAG: hypothetical protein LQ351_006723 [Letrouitia transgressa]